MQQLQRLLPPVGKYLTETQCRPGIAECCIRRAGFVKFQSGIFCGERQAFKFGVPKALAQSENQKGYEYDALHDVMISH